MKYALEEQVVVAVNRALTQKAPDLLKWLSEPETGEKRDVQLREVVNAARAPYIEVLNGLPETEIGERFALIQGMQVSPQVLAALVDLREAVEAKLEALRQQALGGACG